MNEPHRESLSRRQLLGAGIAGTTLLGCGSVGRRDLPRTDSGALPLPMAGYPYNRVRALSDGQISVEGCRVEFEHARIGEMNTHVLSAPRTRAVSEIGLSPFVLAYANEGFRDYSLLPVFPLRLFRHKSIFVRKDRGITEPGDLRGKRVATPGYSTTSLTWIRGLLQHEYGVAPNEIHWVLSAEDSSVADGGAPSKQEGLLPDGLTVSRGTLGKDESELLVDGEVDALFHAIEPRAYTEGHPLVGRLFDDSRAAERRYYAKTGIFPIMHAVAIRNDLCDQHPWLPQAVFNAYSRAKQSNYLAMRKEWQLSSLPWYAQELESTRELMGDDFWPYGIARNRKTLNTLLRYSYAQGLASRELRVEEIFHPATLELSERA